MLAASFGIICFWWWEGESYFFGTCICEEVRVYTWMWGVWMCCVWQSVRVCVCERVCVSEHLYVWESVCEWASVCVRVCVWESQYQCMRVSLCEWESVCVSESVLGERLYVWKRVCEWASVCVWEYVWASESVSECASVCVSVSVSELLCERVCVRVSVYVRESVCVCARGREILRSCIIFVLSTVTCFQMGLQSPPPPPSWHPPTLRPISLWSCPCPPVAILTCFEQKPLTLPRTPQKHALLAFSDTVLARYF